jgi:hypothetical protein
MEFPENDRKFIIYLLIYYSKTHSHRMSQYIVAFRGLVDVVALLACYSEFIDSYRRFGTGYCTYL